MSVRRIAALVTYAIALALAAALLPTELIAQSGEPSWKVFDESGDKTPQPIVDAMLKLGNVRANDVVYDLGCGDGRIVVTAAKRFGAKALGIDFNPKMIVRAKANAEKNHVVDNATFVEGDIFKLDLSPATVITLFLWPTVNIKLRPRLLDLAPGTRIVSHEHDMEDWKPDRTVWVSTHDKDWGERDIHLWIVPVKIAGNWQLSIGGRSVDVPIDQKFQRFSGSARVDGVSKPVRNGRINGTEISFDLATSSGKPRRYMGRVSSSHEMSGEGWQASRKGRS
jgi:SAM-dependent methyltransferase